MIYLIIGALTAISFILLLNYSRKYNLTVKWWQWMVTVLAFLYTVFVLASIVSFLEEGSPRGALVMGMIMGMIAIIWGVLLARFVFARRT